MKQLAFTAALALAFVATSPEAAQAMEGSDGPGTAFFACREEAKADFWVCLQKSDNSFWGDLKCSYAGGADLAACDLKLIKDLSI